MSFDPVKECAYDTKLWKEDDWTVTTADRPMTPVMSPNDLETRITKPSHYIEGRKYEPRKVIRDWGLNFNLGNAVKYIARAGRKGDAVEDLLKAKQYLEFELEELTK